MVVEGFTCGIGCLSGDGIIHTKLGFEPVHVCGERKEEEGWAKGTSSGSLCSSPEITKYPPTIGEGLPAFHCLDRALNNRFFLGSI